MGRLYDWIEDTVDWFVNGPAERCVMVHHPDDEEARRLANEARAAVSGFPAAIHAADSLTLDDETWPVAVGRMFHITIYRPGLWREWLWRARPVHVKTLSCEGRRG